MIPALRAPAVVGGKEADQVKGRGVGPVLPALDDPRGALHVSGDFADLLRPSEQRRLYLTFLHDESTPSSPWNRFAKVLRGPLRRVDLVIVDAQGELTRIFVGPPNAKVGNPQGRVTCTDKPFDSVHDWRTLAVPAAPEQIDKVEAAIADMQRRGCVFSERAKMLSGYPWLPEWLRARLFGPPVPNGTFCSKMCLEALAAAGILENIPPDTSVATDVWAAALWLQGARPIHLVRRVLPVDTAGYPVNEEYARTVMV